MSKFKLINLTKDDHAELKSIKLSTGLSMSQIIHNMIQDYDVVDEQPIKSDFTGITISEQDYEKLFSIKKRTNLPVTKLIHKMIMDYKDMQ